LIRAAAGDAFTPLRVIRKRQCAVALLRRNVLACDRPDAPKQSAKPGTTDKLLTTGSMYAFMSSSSASLEVSVPSALTAASHASLSEGGQPPNASRFGVLAFHALAGFRCSAIKTVRLELADVRGGRSILSIAARLRGAWIDKTLRPSSSTSPCRCNRCNRSARSRQIQPYRAPPLRSGRPISHHAPARPSARCSATRGGHSRPGRAISWQSPPSLHFSPGGTPGFFCAPRRFAPANGCRAVSGVPGPRVVSLAARPTRLIFVGLTDRLVEKARKQKGGRPGTFSFNATFDFWASLPSAIRIPQLQLS